LSISLAFSKYLKIKDAGMMGKNGRAAFMISSVLHLFP